MSVNRFKTMKPLLLQSASAPVPAPESLTAFGGIIAELDLGIDAMVRLATVAKGACRVFARIAPINHVTERELAQLLRSDIDGIMLSGCRGRADIQKLDVMLRVAEANAGGRRQSAAIIAEFGTTPESVLSPHALDGSSSRLEGLVFDGRALATALGCRATPERPDEIEVAPIAAGRAAAVLRAREAGLDCHEILPRGLSTETAVRRAFAASRANGFSSVVCRLPEQTAWLVAEG